MTVLAYIGDGGLETHDNEPGVALNTSELTTLLRVPTLQELKILWRNCEAELRQATLELFLMTNREARDRYGLLGRGPESYLEGEDLWGLSALVTHHPKGFQRISTAAAVRALADAGLLSATVRGVPRRRLRTGQGGLAKHIQNLARPDQEAFLRRLLADAGSLDEALLVNQACDVGTQRLNDLLQASTSAEDFLELLAEEARANLLEREVRGVTNQTTGGTAKGAGRWYAPIWFALFLVREGIWLLPAITAARIGGAFPIWAGPLHAKISVPASRLPLASQVQRDFLADPNAKPDAKLIFTQMMMLAACSNIWRADTLCVEPLVGVKRWFQSQAAGSATQRGWAINRLYESCCHFHGVPTNEHPRAYNFFLGPRLARTTVPFNWVDRPNKRNLSVWKRIFGTEPTSMPETLLDWAEDLRTLLSTLR